MILDQEVSRHRPISASWCSRSLRLRLKYKCKRPRLGGVPHLTGVPHLPEVPPPTCKQALMNNYKSGREIAPDTGANETKFLTLATKS